MRYDAGEHPSRVLRARRLHEVLRATALLLLRGTIPEQHEQLLLVSNANQDSPIDTNIMSM
jgi:hypothetical protein